jgi:hypothetical protein
MNFLNDTTKITTPVNVISPNLTLYFREDFYVTISPYFVPSVEPSYLVKLNYDITPFSAFSFGIVKGSELFRAVGIDNFNNPLSTSIIFGIKYNFIGKYGVNLVYEFLSERELYENAINLNLSFRW